LLSSALIVESEEKKKSITRSNIYKDHTSKEPPTTLPQWNLINLLKLENISIWLGLFYLKQYQLAAYPETQKLKASFKKASPHINCRKIKNENKLLPKDVFSKNGFSGL